jgi:hypothetical protein
MTPPTLALPFPPSSTRPNLPCSVVRTWLEIADRVGVLDGTRGLRADAELLAEKCARFRMSVLRFEEDLSKRMAQEEDESAKELAASRARGDEEELSLAGPVAAPPVGSSSDAGGGGGGAGLGAGAGDGGGELDAPGDGPEALTRSLEGEHADAWASEGAGGAGGGGGAGSPDSPRSAASDSGSDSDASTPRYTAPLYVAPEPLAPVRVVEAGAVAVQIEVARDEMPDFGSSSEDSDASSSSEDPSSSDDDSSVPSPRMGPESSISPRSASPASSVGAGPSVPMPGGGAVSDRWVCPRGRLPCLSSPPLPPHLPSLTGPLVSLHRVPVPDSPLCVRCSGWVCPFACTVFTPRSNSDTDSDSDDEEDAEAAAEAAAAAARAAEQAAFLAALERTRKDTSLTAEQRMERMAAAIGVKVEPAGGAVKPKSAVCALFSQPTTAGIMNEARSLVAELHAALSNALGVAFEDAALVRMVQRCGALVVRLAADASSTQFLFEDGPFTRAARQTCRVLLENLDKPDQSVTERLNGSLEVEVGPDMAVHRVLCVSEAVDGTSDGGGGPGSAAPGGASSSAAAGAIVLQPGFAVFATVHATESEALALSPATRSRFTEIWCPAYDKEDMMQVCVTAGMSARELMCCLLACVCV